MKTIRVLIVDDSILFREALSRELRKDPLIEVVGSASDPYDASEKIMALRPDVLTLDVEMPKMDGIEFLRRLLPQYPIPVVMSSSISGIVFEALAAGAVDFVAKPDMGRGMEDYAKDLCLKIKVASEITVRVKPRSEHKFVSGSASDADQKYVGQGLRGGTVPKPVGAVTGADTDQKYVGQGHRGGTEPKPVGAVMGVDTEQKHMGPGVRAAPERSTQKSVDTNVLVQAQKALRSTLGVRYSDNIIAIGASTGGTEAIFSILTQLPGDLPGIVMVQHMPQGFTSLYAERLDRFCAFNVREALDGDRVEPGLALLAPGGDRQMKVLRDPRGYCIKLIDMDKVSGHRPSVDYLFESVAEAAGNRSIGVILTGMGADGAKGLLKMKEKGAYTIGQDKGSCVVYGMPMAAYNMGAVSKQLPLMSIAREITDSSRK